LEFDKKTVAILMVVLVFVSLMGTFLVLTRANAVRSVPVSTEQSTQGVVSMTVMSAETLEKMKKDDSAGIVSLNVVKGE
jgi:hypothetical protein